MLPHRKRFDIDNESIYLFVAVPILPCCLVEFPDMLPDDIAVYVEMLDLSCVEIERSIRQCTLDDIRRRTPPRIASWVQLGASSP